LSQQVDSLKQFLVSEEHNDSSEQKKRNSFNRQIEIDVKRSASLLVQCPWQSHSDLRSARLSVTGSHGSGVSVTAQEAS